MIKRGLKGFYILLGMYILEQLFLSALPWNVSEIQVRIWYLDRA